MTQSYQFICVENKFFKFEDVLGDGNCFFNCLVKSPHINVSIDPPIPMPATNRADASVIRSTTVAESTPKSNQITKFSFFQTYPQKHLQHHLLTDAVVRYSSTKRRSGNFAGY